MRINVLAMVGLLRGLFVVLLLGFATAALAGDKGLLWKLQSPQGSTSYLFGTMHTDDKRVTDIAPVVMQALRDSEQFLMELQPPVDPSIFLMKQGRLEEMLTEEELAEVRRRADFHSMPAEIVSRMKPWMLAVILDLPRPQSPYTLDVLLMSLAHGQSKPIGALETAEEQATVLDSFGIEEQLVMLRSALRRTQEERERNFEELVQAYLSGELDRIVQVNARQSGDKLPQELWGRIMEKLLDERNVRMAERIRERAAERSVFVAIGAAHLPGEGGLLARLRAAGFQVTPVR
jgi:uncharacterized protein YbaP (TraB family)